MQRISIIIPAYNEESVIKESLTKISKYMENRFVYEMVVADDGSTDRTSIKVLEYSVAHPLQRVLCVKSSHNMGKGHAVRMGISEAKYRLKLIIDADLSISPVSLEDVSFDEDWDIVKGQRYQIIKQPMYRIFVGKAFRVLTWLITGIYMDSQAPFTLLNVHDNFFKRLSIDGFAFDVEILYEAKRCGLKVKKIPVPYFNDPNSKVTFRKTMKMFSELLRIRFKKK